MVANQPRVNELFEAHKQAVLHSLLDTCLIGAVQWWQSLKTGGVRFFHQSIRCFQARDCSFRERPIAIKTEESHMPFAAIGFHVIEYSFHAALLNSLVCQSTSTTAILPQQNTSIAAANCHSLHRLECRCV